METVVEVPSDQAVAVVVIGEIIIKWNPRKYFDPIEMDALTEAVRAQGILQPILLRKTEEGLVLVAGERRLRAAIAVYGMTGTIPAMIRVMTDDEAAAAALNENRMRSGISEAEESDEAARLVALLNGNRAEAARRLGWKPDLLARRLILQHCSVEVRKALAQRKIHVGHAELLAAAPPESQDKVLAGVIEQDISVAALKSMLMSKTKLLANACFDTRDCATCHHNSDRQMDLLEVNVGAGHCTNWNCFDQKTAAHVQVLADRLAEEVPQVRIIEPGDVRPVIFLRPIGPAAVGEAQYESCKGCDNFGATVSRIPGEEGHIERSRCFDAVCHTVKAAAYLESQKPQATASDTDQDEAKANPSKPAAAKAAAPSKTGSAKVIPSKVEEYRYATWRKLIRERIQADPQAAQAVMFGLILDRDARLIEAHGVEKRLQEMAGKESSFMPLPDKLLLCMTASEEVRQVMVYELAATMVDSMEKRKVPLMLRFLEVDMATSWQISAEYLNLLTKSEMESLAAEIGLKKHMGESFGKLLNQKRDELIKQFMAAQGFSFEGIVPKAMDYTKLK